MKRVKTMLFCVMAAVAALASTACQKESVKVTSISFSEETCNVTENAKGFTISCSVSPAEATTPITWGSSNKDVAVINNDGTITFKGYGETQITASADGITAICKLIVYADLFKHQWYCHDTSESKWIDIFTKTGEGTGTWSEWFLDESDTVASAIDAEDIHYSSVDPVTYVIKFDDRPEDTFLLQFETPDTFKMTWVEDNYFWYGTVSSKEYVNNLK